MHIESGQVLPRVDAMLDGEPVDLATHSAGSWSVVLFYRGHW